ncbi:unnamed protein product [Brassicogethes aeneus]|uniref:Uncharacterized protein n=1 Tax=Brassicogethes aeneus TaxID=1431903 RepID=A0A9P0B299_BRAAE|nr:unnamed protein product [Brassicogethes aeneus]
MQVYKTWITLLVFGTAILCQIEARRVRVQPVEDEQEDESIQYYAAEPQEDQRQVVLVSSADQYNGLYGQPTASPRVAQDNYIPRGHAKSHAVKTKEAVKAPPVQTIRNYNKVNDDGSFTFGYEAADGSFKEETRGTDCVVRGKYGYVDPDGNKREFTYVSGNPCDPNAPKDQDDQAEPESAEQDSGPANYPTRPVQRIRPLSIQTPAPKPAQTLFQNTYAQEDEQPEPEQLLRPQHIRRPSYITRPQYLDQSTAAEQEEVQQYHRPTVSSTTPASVIYRHSTPLTITPRPVSASTTARSQLPATTYRPHLLQVAVTPRPSSLLYTKQLSSPSSTIAPSRGSGNIDFDAEFQRFQDNSNHIASSTPSSKLSSKQPAAKQPGGNVYSSALVYDPSSGQYNTQLYQTLPQTEGDFTLNQRIQPYVHQPNRQVVNIQQLQQQSPLYSQNLRPQPTPSQLQSALYQPTPAPSRQTPQAAYQQQQSEIQYQNSAQLYAQQTRARGQPQRPAPVTQEQPQQPVYYISQPQLDGLASSQIDAFLRGHNIQF